MSDLITIGMKPRVSKKVAWPWPVRWKNITRTNKERTSSISFQTNKFTRFIVDYYKMHSALLSFIRMLILPQLSSSLSRIHTKNTAMTTPEPSCPNSYPNIQTNSNPFSYFTSQTQHHPSPSSQPIHDRNIQFLRRLIAALLLTFILISTISIISWLILHPRVPVVRVDSLSITNFNLSSSQLTTASYEVNFTVRNLNRKINLEVESLKVSVLYKRSRLSRGPVQPFDVRKMNQTGVRVELGTNPSNGFPVWKERAAAEMGREWRDLGVVSLKLRMGGLVKFKAAKWLTKQSSIDVFCDNLVVGLSPDNNNILTGRLRTTLGKDCSAYLL